MTYIERTETSTAPTRDISLGGPIIYNGDLPNTTGEGDPLERYQKMLLAVWREACQHIEIHESLAGIARLLGESMPLAQLAVERIEPEHHWIATVAVAPSGHLSGEAASRECTAAQMK